MKKLFPIFILIISLCSCSNDDGTNATNTDLLQRVDFHPGQADERRWYFNSDGLLDEIKTADGMLYEKFVYDSNNNVVQDVKYYDGEPVETYNISYVSNKISSINETSYTYSAAEHRYYYTIGNEAFSCEVNSDGLATHYAHSLDFDGEANDTFEDYYFNYQNGNLANYSAFGNNFVQEQVNFEYGNMKNPLKNGALAVFRIKSLLDPGFLMTGNSSDKVKETKTYATDDSISSSFGILIYPSNKLELLTEQIISGDALQSILTDSYYYYQGE